MSDNEVLGIILSRLNHQDKTLDEIKRNQSELRGKLDTHIQLEEGVKPSIDELIAVLQGSKMIGHLGMFFCRCGVGSNCVGTQPHRREAVTWAAAICGISG